VTQATFDWERGFVVPGFIRIDAEAGDLTKAAKIGFQWI